MGWGVPQADQDWTTIKEIKRMKDVALATAEAGKLSTIATLRSPRVSC
jgi:hypothetical protein